MNSRTQKSIKILRYIHSNVFANNRISKQTGSHKGGTPELWGIRVTDSPRPDIPVSGSPQIQPHTCFQTRCQLPHYYRRYLPNPFSKEHNGILALHRLPNSYSYEKGIVNSYTNANYYNYLPLRRPVFLFYLFFWQKWILPPTNSITLASYLSYLNFRFHV